MMLSKRFREYNLFYTYCIGKIIHKLQNEALYFQLQFLSISMRSSCERKLSVFQCPRTYGILAHSLSGSLQVEKHLVG